MINKSWNTVTCFISFGDFSFVWNKPLRDLYKCIDTTLAKLTILVLALTITNAMKKESMTYLNFILHYSIFYLRIVSLNKATQITLRLIEKVNSSCMNSQKSAQTST